MKEGGGNLVVGLCPPYSAQGHSTLMIVPADAVGWEDNRSQLVRMVFRNRVTLH